MDEDVFRDAEEDSDVRSFDVVLVEDEEGDDIDTLFVLFVLLSVPFSSPKSDVILEPSL